MDNNTVLINVEWMSPKYWAWVYKAMGTTVLTVQDKWIFVFYKEKFQRPVPSRTCIIEYTSILLFSHKITTPNRYVK